MRNAAGFTLIETIVSLVILATALAAFYDFLSTELRGAGRVEAAAEAYDRHMNALELASALNPLTSPQGSFDLGTYRIDWTSEPLTDLRQSTRYPVGRGVFEVGLYRVTFTFSGDPAAAPISVTRLGYRRDDLPNAVLGAGN